MSGAEPSREETVDQLLTAAHAADPFREIEKIATLLESALVLASAEGDERVAVLVFDRDVARLRANGNLIRANNGTGRFGPILDSGGAVWPSPDGFSEAALAHFASQAGATASLALRARYNDFLCEKGPTSPSGERYRRAKAALDAYLAIARICGDSLLRRDDSTLVTFLDSLDRAVAIALRFKMSDGISATADLCLLFGDRFSEQGASKDWPAGRFAFEPLTLLVYLAEQTAGRSAVPKESLQKVRALAIQLADTHASGPNYLWQHHFLLIAERASALLADGAGQVRARFQLAEASEAEANRLADRGEHLVAAGFFESTVARYAKLRSIELLDDDQRLLIDGRLNSLGLRIRQEYRDGRIWV